MATRLKLTSGRAGEATILGVFRVQRGSADASIEPGRLLTMTLAADQSILAGTEASLVKELKKEEEKP